MPSELKYKIPGCGIDAEALRNVFKPLYSTKKDRGGTGLGTWIAKQIINEHRGQIDIRSKPGVGTTIYVELPISPDDVTPLAHTD